MRDVKKQYLSAVKKELHAIGRAKRPLLQRLDAELTEYLDANPGADAAAVSEAFGTPQETAQTFMESLPATAVKKAFTWKRVVLIGVIAAILIWLGVVVTSWIDGHIQNHGYGTEEILEELPADAIILEDDEP